MVEQVQDFLYLGVTMDERVTRCRNQRKSLYTINLITITAFRNKAYCHFFLLHFKHKYFSTQQRICM